MKPNRISVHVFHVAAASAANRGEFGDPKTLYLGGVERDRWSGQALGRPARLSEIMAEEFGIGPERAIRTRDVVARVTERVLSLVNASGASYSKTAVDKAVTEVLVANGLKKSKEKDGAAKGKGKAKAKPDDDVEEEAAVDDEDAPDSKTPKSNDAVMFVMPAELEEIATVAVKILRGERLAPGDSTIVRDFRHVARSVDVALWGRMFAACPEAGVLGALRASHAFTVGAGRQEEDFFVTMADGEKQAAHMGHRMLSSGIFYTLFHIDRRLLINNLGGDEVLADRVIRVMIGVLLRTVPQGRGSASPVVGTPDWAMVELADELTNGVAAFVIPVDTLPDAAKALLDLADRTDRNTERRVYRRVMSNHPGVPGEATIRDLCGILDAVGNEAA